MSNIVNFPKNKWDYIRQYNQSFLACLLASQYDEEVSCIHEDIYIDIPEEETDKIRKKVIKLGLELLNKKLDKS